MSILSASFVPSQTDQAVIQELQDYIREQRDARLVRKALAVKLLHQGYKHSAIMVILDVSSGSISAWKSAYEKEGVNGFALGYKGRKSYLSDDEREAVLAWLQSQDVWTLGELESHLAEKYGVSYESKQSYYDLFSAAGISWQKASHHNPKADAKAVAAKKPRLSVCWRSTESR